MSTRVAIGRLRSRTTARWSPHRGASRGHERRTRVSDTEYVSYPGGPPRPSSVGRSRRAAGQDRSPGQIGAPRGGDRRHIRDGGYRRYRHSCCQRTFRTTMTRNDLNIVIRPLNRDEALAVAAWRYSGELAMYDSEPGQEVALLTMTGEGYGYYALLQNDDFVGYCCFGPEGRVPGQPAPTDDLLDLGGGLRPDLIGKGLGAVGLPVILAFARERFSPPGFRTAIASFNRRSIVLCRWAGFRPSCMFSGPGRREFTELVLKGGPENRLRPAGGSPVREIAESPVESG
jgi:ribosomal-protein-alanine N-acetyltransferase